MGFYGADFYGTGLYGLVLDVEYESNLRVSRVIDGLGGDLEVLWDVPQPQAEWDALRLLRSLHGFASYADEGLVLVNAEKSGTEWDVTYANDDPETTPNVPIEYRDGDLPEGRFVYYTLMVHHTADAEWRYAGKAIALVVQRYDFQNWLYEHLPTHWRSRDQSQSLQLQRFLQGPGFITDETKTHLDTLTWTRLPRLIRGDLLYLLGDTLGIPPEPLVGIAQYRVLIDNIMRVRKRSGTTVSVEALASAYTGYGADASVGYNLATTNSFTGWSAVEGVNSGTAVVSTSPADAGTDLVLSVDSDVEEVQSTPLPIADNALLWGVPVDDATTYHVSLDVWARDVSQDARIDTEWYDDEGTLLGTTTGTTVTTAVGAWTTMTATGATPAGATRAVTRVLLEGYPGDGHEFRRWLFEEGGASAGWQTAREIQILFTPVRVNLVENPSFETDALNWSVGANSALSQSATVARFGASSGALDNTAGTTETVTTWTDKMAVEEGLAYTGSVFAQPAAGSTNLDVVVSIRWYDAADALLATTVGAAETEEAGTWVRATVTGTAPVDATQAELLVTHAAFPAADEHFIDGALFEHSSRVKTYFDASFSGSDYFWEGTAHESPSYFFPDRSNRTARLLRVLPAHTPPDQQVVLGFTAAQLAP